MYFSPLVYIKKPKNQNYLWNRKDNNSFVSRVQEFKPELQLCSFTPEKHESPEEVFLQQTHGNLLD